MLEFLCTLLLALVLLECVLVAVFIAKAAMALEKRGVDTGELAWHLIVSALLISTMGHSDR